MIWFILVAVIVVLDQVVKYVIVNCVDMGNEIVVINNFFYITHTENKGAAWSILWGGRYFFIALTVCISIFLIYYLHKSRIKLLNTALSFILGGAIGNCIDRVLNGSVVDFLEFHFGSYIFPIFNVADMFVVTGSILFAYYLLFVYKE